MRVGEGGSTSARSDLLWILVENGPPVAARFVEEGETLFIVPTGSGAAWLTRILQQGEARILVANRPPERCSARLVTTSDRLADILLQIRTKYGDVLADRYFADSTRAVAFRRGEPAGAPIPYHEVVRQEFDAVSSQYSRQIERSQVHRLLKGRSLLRLRALFEGRDPLLELGSGTGQETLPLLAAGHRVHAVDISPRMLEELRRAAGAADLGPHLTTYVGAIKDLDEVLADTPSASFRGAYSTFGALNLEPDLARLPATLGRVLEGGAPFFAAVLQRDALIPAAFTLALGHPRMAVRRFGPIVPAGSPRFTLDVHATRLRAFARLMSPHFVLAQVEPVSVACPPIDLPRLWNFLGEEGLRRLDRLDEWAVRRRTLLRLAEWAFLTFRRR